MLRIILPVLLALLATGCANLNTVYREVTGSPTAQRSIVVDASQRAIVSVNRKTTQGTTTTSDTMVCPEPFPDALAAFFASGAATAGITATDGATKQLQAAIAAGSAVASFGLRTNSTVLLTNSLSSNCFAFMNGATNNPGYMELQRRSQTFNLGILAIEQLTGVVKGDQVAVGGNSTSSTGTSDTTALQKALDTAEKDQTTAATNLKTAKDKRDTKFIEEKAQNTVKTAAEAKLAAAPDAAAKQAAQADLTTQTATLETLQGELAKLETELTTAIDTNNQARQRVGQAHSALADALGKVQTAGSTTTSNESSRNAVLTATPAVAQAVTQIVQSVLLEAGRGEGCNAIIADYPKNGASYQTGVGADLLKQCVADRKLTTDMLQKTLSSSVTK